MVGRPGSAVRRRPLPGDMVAKMLALALVVFSRATGAAAADTVDPTKLALQLQDIMNESEYDKKVKEKKADKKELKMAFCVIDAIQAAVSLGQAGVGITEATHSCKPVKDPYTGNYAVPKGKEAACAETITFIITTFGHVAVFLSGAASQCAKSIDLGAYCAVDVADMVTGLSLLAEAGSSMAANCEGGADYDPYDPANANAADGRRLSMAATHRPGGFSPALASSNYAPLMPMWNASGPLPMLPASVTRRLAGEYPETNAQTKQEKRNIAIAMCVFDVLQAAVFLARAGSMIEEVVYACKEEERVEDTYNMEQNKMSTDEIANGLRNKSKMAGQEYLNEVNGEEDYNYVENGENPAGRRLGMLGRSPVFNISIEDYKHAQRVCAVNVLHLISSFAYVGSFLSYAAAKCPEVKDYNAACAGGIINTITGLSIVAASGMDFENSCVKITKNETVPDPYDENPTARRLKESTKALMDIVV